MASPSKLITIVGGGLAGLTLGIGLRQRGVPVVLWEKFSYPRHRVCGEFISGRGHTVLARMQLNQLFMEAGAVVGTKAMFFIGRTSSPPRPVSPAALCLDRFTMDALLARQFQQLGGELRENSAWRGSLKQEGLVLATGRRRLPVHGGPSWFGLKIHARNVELAADVEMHALDNGYVGLTRLSLGRTNVCGIFRGRSQVSVPGLGHRMLMGSSETILNGRLLNAEFDQTSFCSIGGISLAPAQASAHPECRLGDALTMVPPVTGNGMSMAFEAAELALEPLSAWSCGSLSWLTARRRVAKHCDQRFAKRLTWDRYLQWLMLTPLLRGKLGASVLKANWLWNVMFHKTR